MQMLKFFYIFLYIKETSQKTLAFYDTHLQDISLANDLQILYIDIKTIGCVKKQAML